MPFYVESLTLLLLIGVLIGVLLYHRRHHRLLIDGLIAILATGIFASLLLQRRQESRTAEQVVRVRQSLAQLQEQALFYGILREVELGPSGLPTQISPLWFRQGLPMNTMVPGRQPWIDIAPPGDLSEDPPDPVITRPDQAGFWYNPNRGVFRARVTPQWSDEATLRLYNELNGTTRQSLPARQGRFANPMLASSSAEEGTSGSDVGPPRARRRSLKDGPSDAGD